jgi:hypothetical protein
MEFLRHNDNIMAHRFELKIIEAPSGDDGDADEEEREYEHSMLSTIVLDEVVDLVSNLSAKSDQSSVEQFIEVLADDRDYQYSAASIPPDLQLLITTLGDIGKFSHHFDLHDGNFMMRGKQLVVLDPICNHGDLDLNSKFRDFNQGIKRSLENTKQANTKPSSHK